MRTSPFASSEAPDGAPAAGHHLRFHRPHAHLSSAFGSDAFGVKAEAFARFFGTPTFLIVQSVLVAAWIIVNVAGLTQFDLYPFILLNLAFSLQAAYAAPLILLAQTRQADRDKAHADADAQHREALALANEERQAFAAKISTQMLDLLDHNTKLTALTQELSRAHREADGRDPSLDRDPLSQPQPISTTSSPTRSADGSSSLSFMTLNAIRGTCSRPRTVLLLLILALGVVMAGCGNDSDQAHQVELDASFGAGGAVLTAMGETFGGALPVPGAKAVAIQSDGKIVVGGGASIGGRGTFAVARYNADGTLDRTFGTTGTVTTAIGVGSEARALALQPDGKIVLAGSSNPEPSTRRLIALARYNADGTLDSRFGAAGIVTTAIGPTYDEAHAIVLQPDGKIVVAGYGDGQFALARYGADGNLDPLFGNGGKVVTTSLSLPFDGFAANGLALQSDGRLVAAGVAGTATGVAGIAMLRVSPNGVIDSDFGAGGVFTELGSGSAAQAVAVQADGRIVVAGTTFTFAKDRSDLQPTLARYVPAGTLDPSFGNGGTVRTTLAAFQMANAMVLDGDGGIVLAGGTFTGDHLSFALGRYLHDGGLDLSFGGGAITTDLGVEAEANAIALQSDGKIVVAGGALDDLRRQSFALARYLVR